MINVLDYHDPASPDHTAAFVAALSTGRAVFVPKGEYHVDSSAIPVFVPGQRIIGEGKWITRIYCHGPGDAFVLCHQVNANGGNGAGIESLSLVGVDPDPDTMGIRITGGADFTIRDVCVTGFAHLVVLDGCNLARIDGVWLGGAVSGGHIHPNHGLWLTDGPEANRGWTLAGGITNGTTVTNLMVNEGGPCPVQLRGVGTRVIGFHSNAGNWLVGGVNVTVAHGSFETADLYAIVCDGGSHVRLTDIYAGVATLLRVDEQIRCLEVIGCRGQGPHLVECGNHAKLIAPTILACSHWNGSDRAIVPEQVYGENALCQVLEAYRPYSDGRGSLGIGCVQPTGRLDIQYGDEAGQVGTRVREGTVTKWVVP